MEERLWSTDTIFDQILKVIVKIPDLSQECNLRRSNRSGVRGSLGLCPQHDILFDELTVEEHLDFFCKLKGYPSHLVRAETDRMVKALQLESKRKALSATLSGGMKRKLSVGIALCGESKVWRRLFSLHAF